MYRAVTLAGLRQGINLRDEKALAQLLSELHLEMLPGRVLLDGADVTEAIRSAEVTAASAAVADSRTVRQCLVDMQRALAAERNLVCEGRDQGTLVFPDALCKFFLVADPTERARRRCLEMAARGEAASLHDVLEAQKERDRRDAARDLAPMVPAADALILDSTHLDLNQVVDCMQQEVCRCMKGSGGCGTSSGQAF
jgi:cytidylate kinase